MSIKNGKGKSIKQRSPFNGDKVLNNKNHVINFKYFYLFCEIHGMAQSSHFGSLKDVKDRDLCLYSFRFSQVLSMINLCRCKIYDKVWTQKKINTNRLIYVFLNIWSYLIHIQFIYNVNYLIRLFNYILEVARSNPMDIVLWIKYTEWFL